MPNWISNRLVGKGSSERIRNFLQVIKGKKQPVDFERIIPSPEIIRHARKGFSPVAPGLQEQYYMDHIHCRPFTPEEEEELQALEYRSWHDWSCAYWGTDRNAFEVELDDSTAYLGYVVTAWSPPFRILERL
jgi:hypothetical protein